MFRAVLANCTVTDLDRAEDWYTRLFDREPDARPMPGLLEWHIDQANGVQVWSEPERAGKSTVVLTVTDLDDTATRLQAADITHKGTEPGGGARLIPLIDPDGNRVVLIGN